MTGQNRETASEKKNGHKPQTAAVVEPVNEFAGVNEMPNTLLGLDDSGNIQSQAATLRDPRLHSVQRQSMASQIGQLHGNQHLQRVIQAKAHGPKIHSSESNRSAQEAETIEYTELEGLGAAGSLSFVGGNPPPDVNVSSSQIFVPFIQREDDDEDGDRPSEEERARALALARAAEQVAGQKKSEGHADTAKAKDEGEVQADAAKTAKGQAKQASTEANSIKEKRHATVKAHQDAHAAALNAALKGATAEVEGENAEQGAEVEKKAPASPQEDPAFQAVVTRTKKTATHQRHHAPALTKSAEAQAASVPPANDLTSKAQANQVGAMDQAPAPAFNAQAFKAQLMERIAAMAPKTTEEADEFKEKDKLGSVKGEMQGKVSQEKTSSQSPLQDKTKAPPDPSGIEPKQVTELPPADPGAAPGGVSAQDAAPKLKTHGEVEKPFQEGSQSLDKQMADEDVTEEQLSKSNEPEFQGALASKKEAQTQAATAPQEYRSYEGQEVNQAKAQAVGTAQGHLQSMHGDRAQALAQIAGQQTDAKSKDEVARAKVASDIQKIYDRTKTKVETILARLDTDVAAAFEAGSQAANKTFEDYVASKMEAYKEDRYGGWFGWARWLKDKVKGMPQAVNVFYSDGRNLFLKEMDAVITNVAEIIARGLNEAKAEVANGKKEIETYVAQLPSDLKEVGDKAASDIQDKFDSLESKIDAKQNELIEQLAVKYNEKLKAVDTRIEELKAANQGLIDKAVNFVKGVIRTIKKLKDMIVNVLSRIADVVMGIIKDPIGFLGNLIDGIKSGLDNFISNLPKHLLNALLGWLTGELGPMGIQLPDDIFSLEGIFSLVMQLLGLTWDAIRAKAVKLLGEPVVKTLETGFEIFQVLINEGPIGLWKYVKDMFGNIKEMVIDAIMDMIQTEVIQAGIKWILGLLTPAGAFIKAAMAIYDIVKFFIEKASQIGDLIDAIIDGIAAIASGGISTAAKLIENALAKALPIVIGFLASLLGISDVSKKVQGIIEKIRVKVDKAIDWIIMKAKAAAGKLMGAVGFGKEKSTEARAPVEPEKDSSTKNEKAKEMAHERVAEATQKPFTDEAELRGTIGKIEKDLVPKGLQSLQAIPKKGQVGQFDIIAREDVGDAKVAGQGQLSIAQKQKIEQSIASETQQAQSFLNKLENSEDPGKDAKNLQPSINALGSYKSFVENGTVLTWIRNLAIADGLDEEAAKKIRDRDMKGKPELQAAIKALSARFTAIGFEAAKSGEHQIGNLKLTGSEILSIIREIAISVWQELVKQVGGAVAGAKEIRQKLKGKSSKVGIETTGPSGETTEFVGRGPGYFMKFDDIGPKYEELIEDIRTGDEATRERAKSQIINLIQTAELARNATVLVSGRQVISILSKPGPVPDKLLNRIRRFPMIVKQAVQASAGVNKLVSDEQEELSKPFSAQTEKSLATHPQIPAMAESEIASFVESINQAGLIKRHLNKVESKEEQIRLVQFYTRRQAHKVFGKLMTTVKATEG